MTGNQIALWNVRRQEHADLMLNYREKEKIRLEGLRLKLEEVMARFKESELRLSEMRLEWDKQRHEREMQLQEKLGVLNANVNYYNYNKQYESRKAQLEFESTKWADEYSLKTKEFERKYDYLLGTESLKAYGTAARGLSSVVQAGVSVANLFNPFSKLTKLNANTYKIDYANKIGGN